ncbi:apses-domain-containing protein [Zalerion maritima]|uniref:Apses-domain-containing protein n=1 Tax=Zalerion maritima TaxID=339359 RepID=A0AAD5WQX3_9PEZI|nr:apses-domain-containing protein [Zalerion maritima]
MNQQAPDMYYQGHMSQGQPQPPQTVTSGALASYHQQAPVMHPGPGQYSQPSYQPYPYSGLTSPSAVSQVSNPMNPGSTVLPLPAHPQAVGGAPGQFAFDTTGQIAPPGMKPRVTATLWEDEGSLCFQVEARGICVARREDNHMINGTKLLNVAGMTRGRRDGILKSEKIRHVVKIGPMHLKGVWIPFERALDFANKEKITELLYPLFVHNIGALLYHPSNQTRTTQVMAAAERRKAEQQSQMRNGQPPAGGPGLPSIQHHHHSMGMPGASQPPLSSHQSSMGRPPLDRSASFPNPPTSTSSGMGSMGGSDGFTYPPIPQAAPQMSIDTGLTNTRSMPNTPATTPPGNSIQSMPPSYSQQPPVSQAPYDNSRQMYSSSNSQQQSPYQSTSNGTYSQQQPSSYVKTEMGPPSSRPAVSADQADSKPPNGMSQQSGDPGHHVSNEEEGDHDSQEAEYTHGRPPYNYSAPAVGSLTNEQHLAPELTNSPGHQSGSVRATPRTTATAQGYYPQSGSGYTPPNVQQSSSNLYSVMSDDRNTTNGNSSAYAPQGDMQNGYGSHQPVMNGSSSKRGRDDEDDGNMDPKRRKTLSIGEGLSSQYPSMATAPPVSAPRRR